MSFALVFFAAPAVAQEATVQGRVRDDEGAAVSGVLVTVARDSAVVAGTDTDPLGSFRISSLSLGTYTLRVFGLGYAEHTEQLVLEPEGTINLEVVLARQAIELQGISIEAAATRERMRFEELGGATVRELNRAELRAVPGVAEADPIRAVEVLPGVVSTSDFSSSFHVRGGSQDQNLILLDGVPIFSPFHLGGLFSVFNVDLIDRVELQSGGFSAEHGGRVSSVLEIESDAGEGPFRVDAGVSLLSSRAAVGGLVPSSVASALGQSSIRYRVSARRSYFDVLAKPFLEFPYHLTDFQALVEAWSPSGDRFSITAYSGRDVLALTSVDDPDFPLRLDWDWGNDLLGFRWTRPRAGGGSLDIRANVSRYGTGLGFPDFADTEFTSRIQQGQLRVDFDTRPTAQLSVQLGTSLERLSYRNRFATGGTVFGDGNGTGSLLGSYVQTRWSRPREWLIVAGLRFDGWRPDPGAWIAAVSPRLAVKRFFAGGDAAFKVAAGRYTQFLHSVRDEELPLGLDIWVLAGDRAPQVRSNQLQVGVEGYRDIDWFWSVEAYVRSFDGVVTLNLQDDPNTDLDDLLRGSGLSYGTDFLLRKETGALTGWVALSLLKAERTFPDPLALGRPEVTYPPIFDRRVDLDVVVQLPVVWGWDAGFRWNFGTGIPYTRATGSYAYFSPRFVGEGRLDWSDDDDAVGAYGVVLGDRNAERYPIYHRLDVSLRRTSVKSWGTITPYINLLNVYNRRNPLFYFYEYDATPPLRTGVSMFPLLPTFGLEATF
ncbi:MAG: TonB-dependent receptor [Gemmatimonadota bacterium]|nr:TonB-dependent receptor [Gemmatimonadota bacterium]